MTSWAKVGAKCVFIGIPIGQKIDTRGVTVPMVNASYTIRDVISHNSSVFLRLLEIRNPTIMTQSGVAERAYEVEMFRPLITKTQEADTAMFLSLLSSTDVMALAD